MSPLLYIDYPYNVDSNGNITGDIRARDNNAVLPYDFKWIKGVGCIYDSRN